MLALIRIAFVIVFAMAAALSSWSAGFAAATIAGAIVAAEWAFTRRCPGALASIVYGAIFGRLVAVAALDAAAGIALVKAHLEPAAAAALSLAFMYLGAVAAARAAAGGSRAICIPIVRREAAANCAGALWRVRAVFVVAAACGIIAYAAGDSIARRSEIVVPLVALTAGAVVLDLLAGRRLAGVLAVVIPAVAFALAVTGPSFVLVSMPALVNRFVSIEAQQAMLFAVWMYAGLAFMFRARVAGAGAVPLVEFVERRR